MPAGRPRKFQTVAEMEKIAMEYIGKCMEEGKPVLVTGICMALGVWRDFLCEYESGKYDTDTERFSDAVKRLKLYCEASAEEKLYGNQPTGAIFALKNYGWKDRQEIELDATVRTVEQLLEEL